jgi:phospholipid/cholesterol/gamma-HCH transport system substrate-binding protein
VRALADVGPNLGKALAFAPTFPYPQNFIDRAIRGDYLNEFITFDFTVPRLKSGLFLGTRWGQEGTPLVPAPGDPFYANYTKDPLGEPITAPPPAVAGMPPLVDPQQAPALPADPATVATPRDTVSTSPPDAVSAPPPGDPALPVGGGN